jgi:hypothetical protein
MTGIATLRLPVEIVTQFFISVKLKTQKTLTFAILNLVSILLKLIVRQTAITCHKTVVP